MLAEWTKIRTVRSTAWSLILLVVLDLGFTALFVALTMSQWDNTNPGDRAQISADPVSFILGSGFFLSQLTVCVLGVLVIASGYSTGMIRASLLAVPRRLPMLWAKALVFGLVVLVIGVAVSFAAFFIGAAIIGDRMQVSSATRACCAPSSAAACTWRCSACSRSRSARSCGTPRAASPASSGSCWCWRRWRCCCPAASATTSTPTCRPRRAP